MRNAKKPPYDFLNSEQKQSEWGERYKSLIGGKEGLEFQFRIFIDGYHFYRACVDNAEKFKKNVRKIYKNWSVRNNEGHENTQQAQPDETWEGILNAYNSRMGKREEIIPKDPPNMPINMKILATCGADIVWEFQEKIVARFFKNHEIFEKNEDKTFILSNEIIHQAMFPDQEMKPYNRLLKKINAASVVINPSFMVDFYVGGEPNIEHMLNSLRAEYNSGQKTEKDTKAYNEHYDLLKEGKYKSETRVIDIKEYQKFFDTFEKFYENNKVHRGKTKIEICKKGAFKLKEKGVDASLIIGLFIAKDDNKTDAISLITNDSDYYPVIDHFKNVSPELTIFLARMESTVNFSSALKDSVGEGNVLPVICNAIPWSEIATSGEFIEMQFQKMQT